MTITPSPTNRQTIPYGDRPFVDGRGILTFEAYQFLQRLQQNVGSTVTNVDTVITQTNIVVSDLAVVDEEIATLGSEIATLGTEIAAIGTAAVSPLYPVPSGLPTFALPPLAPDRLPGPGMALPPSPHQIQAFPPVQSVVVVSGAAVALTTGSPADVASIVIATAGTYLVTGAVCFTGGSTTTLTRAAGSVGTTSATLGTAPGTFGNQYLAGATLSAIGEDVAITGFGALLALGAGATVYLDAQAAFLVSTLSAYGQMIAVRVG